MCIHLFTFGPNSFNLNAKSKMTPKNQTWEGGGSQKWHNVYVCCLSNYEVDAGLVCWLKSIHFWNSVLSLYETRYFSWCQQGIAFWLHLVPPQKLLCRHKKPILLNANYLFVWHKMFVTVTICKSIFGLAQNI